MALAEWPVYKMVWNRLTNVDGVSTAASGYAWARADEDPGLPFGRVRPVFGTDDSSMTTDVTRPVVQVDVFGADEEDALVQLSAADTSLRAGTGNDSSYDLSGDGFACIGRAERVETGLLADPADEGASPVWHAFARYRFIIQDL